MLHSFTLLHCFTICSTLLQFAPLFYNLLHSFTICSTLLQFAPLFYNLLHDFTEQIVTNCNGLPRKIDPGRQVRLPAGHGGPGSIWSADAALMDTVARLQLDMEEMRVGSRCHRTPGGRTSPGHPRQVTFTSTKVPRLAGVTVGNSIDRCLMPSCDRMDGTTPQLPCSCYLIWRAMR